MEGIQKVYDEAARVLDRIWKVFNPDDVAGNTPTDARLAAWIRADFDSLATNFGISRLKEVVEEATSGSIAASFIKECGQIEQAAVAAAIRTHWQKAFDMVKSGEDVSGHISYMLSDDDLARLAMLHQKRDEYRDKIEELLTDCNFHKECGDFSVGQYSEYLKDYKSVDPAVAKDNEEGLKMLKYLTTFDNISYENAKALAESDEEYTVVYDSVEDFGRAEAESMGIEDWMTPFFDFEAFGQSLIEQVDHNEICLLNSGRVAAR